MTSIETLIAVQRLGKLGILDGLQLTEAFSKHIAHHFKSTSLDSMIATGKEYGFEDSEGMIGANLILSFCHWKLPEEYDLSMLVKTLTEIRNNAIKQDDFERLQQKYKLPTPEEFKTIDQAAEQLKQDQSK